MSTSSPSPPLSSPLSIDPQSLAECPVCLEARRDTAVFVCANGHAICAVCRKRVDICPQGRCAFPDPPVRNRMAESLIEHLAHRCRFGCALEAFLPELRAHESGCPERSVRCPVHDCDHEAEAKRMVGHLIAKHHIRTSGFSWNLARSRYFSQTLHLLVWSESYMSRLTSIVRMSRPPEAWGVAHVPFMLLATRRRNDKLYAWVAADASQEEASKYRCKVTVSGSSGVVIAKKTHVISLNTSPHDIFHKKDKRAVLASFTLSEMLSAEGFKDKSADDYSDVSITLTFDLSRRKKKKAATKGGGRRELFLE